jgi:NADPH:quinone reductase-like Zn-dependent oxidoreductase
VKQVVCVQFSNTPAAAVELREVAVTPPASDEVLIQMIACPINPADLLLLTGRHLYKPDLPASVGIEGVGRVTETGGEVTTLMAGDLVAVPFGGTWREFMTMKAADVLPLPSDVDPLQAAMLSVNPVTAAGLLAGLAPGDWLIQNAANSAVGQLVIRLARRRGVRTINLVRRAELAPMLEALGADVVLVGDDDLPQRTQAATGGAPILRGLDAIAGEAAGKIHRCLGEGGELICYGLLNSDQVILDAADVVFRNVTVKGYSRLRILRQMGTEQGSQLMAELSNLLREGVLHTTIEQVYPISQVQRALEHAELPGRSGKILLSLTENHESD